MSFKNRQIRKKYGRSNNNQKDITPNDFADTTTCTRKKEPKKKSTGNVSYIDAKMSNVTLNDFANSPVCKNRLKKSTNNVMTVLKTFEEEKDWDQKVDDELDGEFVEIEDEEGNVTFVIKKTETRRRKKTISEPSESTSTNVYPMDVWYLLSKYIRPEDVGRFAGICRSTFEVTCTAQFWYGMYKRYYHSSTQKLPEGLQMESLVRKYGLRTSVIRALHYMYPPYVHRLKTITAAIGEHPSVLTKRICESLWQRKICGTEESWVCYFKMREKWTGALKRSYVDFKRPDLLEILDDVSANPEQNCRILQVFCKEFVPVPPVIGQILMSVSLTLSANFRYNRLQLSFGSGIQTDGNINVVILDPVISYKVLDWWHPLYPYNHGIRDLLDVGFAE